ncbi:hypothetical protein HUU53_02520 [Candidatus Micrarchaeota archaeon]|nr:hypothetical protein [Candidatus Micrarchaeota archaeon]
MSKPEKITITITKQKDKYHLSIDTPIPGRTQNRKVNQVLSNLREALGTISFHIESREVPNVKIKTKLPEEEVFKHLIELHKERRDLTREQKIELAISKFSTK